MSRLTRWTTAFAVVAAGAACGGSGDDSDAPLTELPADVEIDVTGSLDTDLCFEAAIGSLGVDFDRRCYPPPHVLFIAEAANAMLDVGELLTTYATLLVTPYPLRVTSVQQHGKRVPWQQDGGGIVVIGGIVSNADTTIEYQLDGENGRCEFRADDVSGCRVG